MWHSCCVKLPIDGAAAWVIILRVVRSMIETAGVVQTPNGECSRTPMSSNRQWTEEVVVVYRVSTPTSDGPVLRLSPPCVRRWRRACAAPSTAVCSAVKKSGRAGPDDDLGCAFHRLARRWRSLIRCGGLSGRAGPDDVLLKYCSPAGGGARMRARRRRPPRTRCVSARLSAKC